MALKIGLLICLVFVFNSAATGSEGGQQVESQTYQNVSPMNILRRKLSCQSLGGQCTKKKQTCPIWLPLEKPYGRPYCRRWKRCCYRDSCPNPIFEYFHVCGTCSSSEDALAFVIELWGQPSTNPRNTTVFDGHNITFTSIQKYNQPSCRSSYVDTWDCYQNSMGFWTNCKKKNGNGGCRSDHALDNGHLFPNIMCYKGPSTTTEATDIIAKVECSKDTKGRIEFVKKHVLVASSINAEAALKKTIDGRGEVPGKDSKGKFIIRNTVFFDDKENGNPITYTYNNADKTCMMKYRVKTFECCAKAEKGAKWLRCTKCGNCQGKYEAWNGHLFHEMIKCAEPTLCTDKAYKACIDI